jgi:hypothetical protein
MSYFHSADDGSALSGTPWCIGRLFPILVIGWNGMHPAHYDELMLKWVSAAVGLSLIAAFVWAHRDLRSIECTQGPMAPGVNPVLPTEKAGQWREARP